MNKQNLFDVWDLEFTLNHCPEVVKQTNEPIDLSELYGMFFKTEEDANGITVKSYDALTCKESYKFIPF